MSLESPAQELERQPDIHIKVLLTAHRTPEDFRKLKDAFAVADVYAPEMLGVPDVGDRLNKLSRGEMTPKEFSAGRFFDEGIFEVLEQIYNSGKPILGVDSPMESAQEIRSSFFYISDAVRKFDASDFTGAIKSYRTFLETFTESAVVQREDYVVHRLREELPKLTEKFPHLRGKSSLEVLVTFGAAHTELPRKIQKETGASVEAEYNDLPMIFSFTHEAMRRYQFKKEIPDELILRGLLESIIGDRIISRLTNDSERMYRIARTVTRPLSVEQIKEVSAHLWVEKNLFVVLDKLGIRYPKTSEELSQFDSTRAHRP